MPTQSVSRVTNVTLTSSSWYEYCNGLWVDAGSSSSSASVEVYKKYKTWSQTPNYRALRRAGTRLPDNNFTFEEARQTAEVSRVEYQATNPCYSGWDVRHYGGHYSLSMAHWLGGVDVGEQRLGTSGVIALLLSRARGAEWNAPVFFAEARQTGQMVLSTARSLASAMRNLRRGNLVGAYQSLAMSPPSAASRRRYNNQFGRDPSRAASNRWLEMQYGWVPLLSDVKNAAETLAENQSRTERTTGRVTARVTLNHRRAVNSVYQAELSPPGYARETSTQEENRRMVWLFRPTDLDSVGSFGLLNPALIAWELIPLSFVVDWFLPIGRYLEQLDTSWRFSHVGGSSGYRRRVTRQAEAISRDGRPVSGHHSSTYVYVHREKLIGMPSLGLDSVRFEPNLGARRIISGLALARQSFR